MNANKPISIQEIKDKINSNVYLKTAVYIGVGVMSLYLIGKVFSIMAWAVKGYNELKSELKGK